MTKRNSWVDTHLHLTRAFPGIEEWAYRPDIDYTTKGLLTEMDAAGIEHGILIQVDTLPIPEGLNEARGIVSQSKGRLHLVSTVDPTQGAAAVAEAIALWEKVPELTGIKLFPGYHPFYPHDRRLDPVYEYAKRRKVPILIHTGDTLSVDGLVKYCRPIEVDEVAVRFRDVRFVLCHFGETFMEEATEMVYKNSNVYADTSGLLPKPSLPFYKRLFELTRKRVEDAIIMIGEPDRILYGSDWPLIDLKVALRLVKELDLPMRDREAILGGNARRLFGLPPARPSRAGAS
jgi:hypothetical protein